MIPVSVVIVTKNEEKNISDALESVKDFEDIVIVDSFSKDKTLEICKKYTDRVYQHEWQGYAKQKQIATDYAEKSWVLILDADERVTPELKEEILMHIKQQDCSGFYIPRKNFFLGKWIKHSGWWPDYTLRLFRKDVSYVEPREVHEKIFVNGVVGYLKNPFEHYTYRTISDYIKKMETYSTLSAKEILSKNPQISSLSLSLKMLSNPFFTFVKMFLIKQGVRDGMYGFILAVLYSFYTFLKYVKIWEMKRAQNSEFKVK
ncbi:glycosyl transferase [Dissulfurispira thermophila]|uniref:Glycosyl transferase n=2 Tax=root TaxID=1 RepID=A0A7G1H6B6_9BACT|nr:glycosyltransferase family 2 protein [Dissulfurispira thermophila]BCB97287.1 glycosyl transferase [Dissulfurispira thermophila]